MNNRIIKMSDGRVCYCADCPYRNRETGFCGFCMRKVIDDVEIQKNKKQEVPADGLQTDSV